MILDEKQREEFEDSARPLINFLNMLSHPHVTAIVDCGRAELLESVVQVVTDDYIKD